MKYKHDIKKNMCKRVKRGRGESSLYACSLHWLNISIYMCYTHLNIQTDMN